MEIPKDELLEEIEKVAKKVEDKGEEIIEDIVEDTPSFLKRVWAFIKKWKFSLLLSIVWILMLSGGAFYYFWVNPKLELPKVIEAIKTEKVEIKAIEPKSIQDLTIKEFISQAKLIKTDLQSFKDENGNIISKRIGMYWSIIGEDKTKENAYYFTSKEHLNKLSVNKQIKDENVVISK